METYYEEVGVLCPGGVGLVQGEGSLPARVATPSPATSPLARGRAGPCLRSGEASVALGLPAFLSCPQIHRLQTLLASSETSGRKYDGLELHSLLPGSTAFPLPWLPRCPQPPARCHTHHSPPRPPPLSVGRHWLSRRPVLGDTTQVPAGCGSRSSGLRVKDSPGAAPRPPPAPSPSPSPLCRAGGARCSVRQAVLRGPVAGSRCAICRTLGGECPAVWGGWRSSRAFQVLVSAPPRWALLGHTEPSPLGAAPAVGRWPPCWGRSEQ